LSILSIAAAERYSAIDMCTGIAESVLRTKAVLPAMFSKFPFQSGSLEATASIRACSSHFFSLKMDSGMPK
jgi:hypothetical protein